MYIPSWFAKIVRFTVFRLLKNAFVKLPPPSHLPWKAFKSSLWLCVKVVNTCKKHALLLTKLLGQFIELHNTQFLKRLQSLTWDCIGFFFYVKVWKTGGWLQPWKHLYERRMWAHKSFSCSHHKQLSGHLKAITLVMLAVHKQVALLSSYISPFLICSNVNNKSAQCKLFPRERFI